MPSQIRQTKKKYKWYEFIDKKSSRKWRLIYRGRLVVIWGQEGRHRREGWQRDKETYRSNGCLVTLTMGMVSQVYEHVKMDHSVYFKYVQLTWYQLYLYKAILKAFLAHKHDSLFKEGPILSTLAQCSCPHHRTAPRAGAQAMELPSQQTSLLSLFVTWQEEWTVQWWWEQVGTWQVRELSKHFLIIWWSLKQHNEDKLLLIKDL